MVGPVGARLTPTDRAAPLATVIIATAAAPQRREVLKRAIGSALSQSPTPHVLVVVNGNRFYQGCLEELAAIAGVEVIYSEVGSYPAAQRVGRQKVTTHYLCFLDDDDELLPGSLAARLARAQQPDQPDVVVTNGYKCAHGVDRPYAQHFPSDGVDVQLSLLEENWLASSAALFRNVPATEACFDGESKFYEWTLIGFRLAAAGCRFAFVPSLGFRVNDTSQSLSKDLSGTLEEPGVLAQLGKLSRSTAVTRQLERRLAAAYHGCSYLELKRGNIGAAWQSHLKSLRHRSGVRYLTYTRHLIWAAMTGHAPDRT